MSVLVLHRNGSASCMSALKSAKDVIYLTIKTGPGGPPPFVLQLLGLRFFCLSVVLGFVAFVAVASSAP